MPEIDQATLIMAIQAVAQAIALEERRSEGPDDPEYLDALQHAEAGLRTAYERERTFDPRLLPWEGLARAGAQD
jgi:hypothetical protein